MQAFLAEHLIECGDTASAEKMIIDGLKQQYDERLLLLVPKLNSERPEIIEKTLLHLQKQNGATRYSTVH